MSFFTQIDSQISPITPYHLEGNRIILFPAHRVEREQVVGKLFLDSLYFYTDSATQDEHIESLKQWILFHSFIFNDHIPIGSYHKGLFNKHTEIANIDSIPKSDNTNCYPREFDNIGNAIYHPNSVTQQFKYIDLYKQTTNGQRELIIFYFNPLSSTNIVFPKYSLFDSSYNKIVNFATLLEIIIGHSADCIEELVCPKCGKKLPQHREESERTWIKKYLSDNISEPEIEDEYCLHIALAYDIRHRTVHKGQIPSAKYVLQKSVFEEYNFDRSTDLFKDNKTALSYLVNNIGRLTRYLMLNEFYNLNQFFKLPTLKSRKISSYDNGNEQQLI